VLLCIFIYISVTFIVFAATMFMVNKDNQKIEKKNQLRRTVGLPLKTATPLATI